jgi:short-subunit dehydrogenase
LAALITGATGGIGEAFARALPKTTRLLLTGRDEAALGRLAAELGGGGRLVETLGADLGTDAGLDAVCAAAERFGVDLLVCNAGLGPFGDFLAVPEAAVRATVLVNVLAPVVLIRRLAPGMIEPARASVRRAGLIRHRGVPAGASAGGLCGVEGFRFVAALGAELGGQPIDVLALCPTATRSRFAERSGFSGTLPGAQSPEHVARSALWALGRRRTLAPGPVSGAVLSGPALVRAGLAGVLQAVLPRGRKR